MRIAVVFPQANRRAGVERVAWDLSDFLGARHDAAFVGLAMEDPTPTWRGSWLSGRRGCFHPLSRSVVLRNMRSGLLPPT